MNVVVTGGSRGIGAACVLQLATPGSRVVINYASQAAAAHELAERVQARGALALAVQADVSNESQVMAMFAQADEFFSQSGSACLNAVVNNAGIVAGKSMVADMSLERLQRLFAINVLGAFLVAREAARRMMKSRGGRGGAIVNISSAAARLGSPAEYVDYAASKGAIDTMTLGLAKELAQEGVRVNAVRPGLIVTDIHASGGQPDRVARFQSVIPMGRGGEADEVARAVCWLLSDQASYCTGSLLDVAGGR